MAAIAASIATQLLPLALNEGIPLLVRMADRYFGSKTGPVKLDWVASTAKTIFKQVTGKEPSAEELKNVVEDAVAKLNNSQELKGYETKVVTPPALQVTLMYGTVIRIDEASIVKIQ